MKIVEFTDIHRAYEKGVNVLSGISFGIENSEVVGLLGRNGAGKTTLIRIAMGMLETQKGEVLVFGLDPRAEPLEVKRRVGYVSEDQALPPFLKVSEIIDFHRALYPTWDDEMASRLAGRFELPRDMKVKTLSKGQARQVALLCAVAHRPELLILDEPAGGLDPSARREFLETSIHLLNEAGTTILFSSHHMTDVERLAGRVVMIHEGKLLLDSPLDKLQENYSLALIPHGVDTEPDGLGGLEGCIAVRKWSDAQHAIFSLAPEQTRKKLEENGIIGARYSRIALEDLFIELMGGQS